MVRNRGTDSVFTLLVCGSRTKSVSGLSAGNFRLSAVA